MRTLFDPTLDVVFKLLFANPASKDILISLLTSVLKPTAPIANVTIKNPELPKEWVTDKGIFLDIHLSFEGGEQIDVEMQSENRPGLRRRALYYWARTFSSQLSRGELYHTLKPSVVIFFMNFNELKGKRLHSIFRALEIHDLELFSRVFEIHAIELPKLVGMSQEELKEEQRLALWGKFFSAKSDEEVEAVAKEDPMIKEAKDILAQLSAKPSAQEMVRQREHAMRMYNFELAAAKEEGMDIGEAKGKAEGKAEDALNMLKDGLPIEKVHAYTGLSLEKIQELIKQMSH